MTSGYFEDDPIRTLIDPDAENNAEIIPDPINGYDRVIPTPETLRQIEEHYCQAIIDTDKDYDRTVWKQMAEDFDAYEGRAANPGVEMISLPITKRIVNQQVAWQTTSILSQDPIMKVKPLDGGTYTIPISVTQPPAQPAAPGAPPAPPQPPTFETVELSSEEAADLLETYLQYKLTQCVRFAEVVEDVVFAAHTGEAPTWISVTYDPEVRFAKQHKFVPVAGEKNRIQIVGLEETKIQAGESVKIEHVSGTLVTMPMTATDEQTAPWLAHKNAPTNMQLWEGFQNRKYDLCKPDGEEVTPQEILQIIGLSENMQEISTAEAMAQIDQRIAEKPDFVHDVRTVYFFYPIRRKVTLSEASSPDQPEKKGKSKSRTVIEIRSLCGEFHIRARKLLNLYVNPYWHAKRPLVPCFQRKRPHRFSGMSTAGDVAPIQRLMSLIFHGQLQNLVQQNTKIFMVRANSETMRYMIAHPKRRPGETIPYTDEKDYSAQQLGSQVQSMAAEIQFLSSEGEHVGVYSETDAGIVSNRTPGSTLQQTQMAAKIQPQATLRAIRRTLSRVVEMYLQTVAQFHQYEYIPFRDPETKQLISKLIGFPRETIANHFSFVVAATGEEDTPQATIEKTTILLGQADKRTEQVMKLGEMIIDPDVPDPAVDIAIKLLVGREQLYERLLLAQRLDAKSQAITEKQLRLWRTQAQQAAQQKAAAEANQPPPPPPPPDSNFNFKADLPPWAVDQVLTKLGFTPPPQPQEGAPNGQLSPAPGGATVPQPSPGPAGPVVPPEQPGPAGMAQPPSAPDLSGAGAPGGSQ